MTSYRRYVAEHGAAVARAKRQIRRHSMETGPADYSDRVVAACKFKSGCHRVVTCNPGCATDSASTHDSDRIVAYRFNKVLRCLEHPITGPGSVPLTSEDLPNGGFCTHVLCGRDVLAVSDRYRVIE